MTKQWSLHRPIFFNTAMSRRPTHNLEGVGKNGAVLRHLQFLNDMNAASITVKNVGYWIDPGGNKQRYPLVVLCDPLMQGSFDGLMPAAGDIYEQEEMLVGYVVKNQLLMGVAADAHVSETHVNLDALTKVIITPSYYNQMTQSEQAKADRYLFDEMEIPSKLERQNDIAAARTKVGTLDQILSGERWLRYANLMFNPPYITLKDEAQSGQNLTVAQVQLLHGKSPDGEFRDFLFNFDHCIEPTETGGKALPKWVPYMQDVWTEVITSAIEQHYRGVTAPEVRVVSFHKNDLRPGVPNGLRGTEGNLYQEFVLASQYGMPQGPAHDNQRKVLIFGMGTPYTILYAALDALAMGFHVYLQMDATFNFEPSGISMLELVRLLRHLFPFAFHAMIGWNQELMGGPQPKNARGQTYNQKAAIVKQQMVDEWQRTGGARLNMQFYPFAGSELMDVVDDYTK